MPRNVCFLCSQSSFFLCHWPIWGDGYVLAGWLIIWLIPCLMNCPQMWLLVEKFRCSRRLLLNEWAANFEVGLKEKQGVISCKVENFWSAHSALHPTQWRDESDEDCEIRLWTIFTELDMAGWDGWSTVYALFAACDHMKSVWGGLNKCQRSRVTQ